MGVSSGKLVYARYCDEPRCADDRRKTLGLVTGCLAGLAACLTSSPTAAETIRIATIHSELTRKGPGLLLRDIQSRKDPQVLAIIETITTVAPDILLLTDIDQDPDGLTAQALSAALADHNLPLPHWYVGPSNKGVPSGLDLDQDGRSGEPEDAIGYGRFYGNGGMTLLSRFPIVRDQARDHASFLWSDLPDNLRHEAQDAIHDIPLSGSGHWVVPVDLGEPRPLTLLAYHASTPVFDDPEDRNGRRNHDESAFWSYILTQSDLFPAVLLGNSNIDPTAGEGRRAAFLALLNGPFQNPEGHRNRPTVDWPENPGPGNLRVDYVLPSDGITITASGVYWPDPSDPASETVSTASRHRLVWVDIDTP